ncbi:hypothetical protein [Auraticoccus monumenti]|uniref:Uncharacterized protein n=1 Tax=Auraticoccus monumenti TaxID=675864 RepID=A0A1G7DE31_9ACTN|nr:hypothetical protein [Auraticoccus monumenti]SDE49246.1 hypothetical protein SAMN04489747_3557 [Auraticoccus monumenti]
MPELAAITLVTHLNALQHTPLSADVAASQVAHADVAHHVVDPEGLLGLDPLRANDLTTTLLAVQLLAPGSWLLALPRPGALGVLRGPPALTTAALQAGAAVVHADGGWAFVPHRVGPAVQWQVLPAARPFPSPGSAEAERVLATEVISASRELARLDAASGARPEVELPAGVLPAAYPARQQRAAERALRLLTVAETALADDRDVLSSFAVTQRAEVLRRLEAAATDALCAACAWPEEVPRR